MGFMKRTGKIPQPYFFQMRDESTFAFAGIWDEWNLDHQSITSCAIVTTTANELLAPIHDLYALTLSRPDSLRKRRLRPSRTTFPLRRKRPARPRLTQELELS